MSVVARRHDVNANQLFRWRKQYHEGLLTQVLVSKYCDHMPLYRQSQIYARDGVDLPRSTLATG